MRGAGYDVDYYKGEDVTVELYRSLPSFGYKLIVLRVHSAYVPKYLSDNGFDIIPINPTASEILGKKCYDSISEIDDEIEIIDIFRPSEQVLQFVEEAIKKKPKVIWLQEGIHNFEAEELARKEGIKVVFNRCMLAEHRRLH